MTLMVMDMVWKWIVTIKIRIFIQMLKRCVIP